MAAFLAQLVSLIVLPLIEKLFGGLVDWGRNYFAAKSDESKTAATVKETTDATTLAEREQAALDSARNTGN